MRTSPQLKWWVSLIGFAIGLGGAVAASRNSGGKKDWKEQRSQEYRPIAAESQQPSGPTSLAIDRNVIAGGGGTSSGGSFTANGTIGEPAAGTVLSGGNFAQ